MAEADDQITDQSPSRFQHWAWRFGGGLALVVILLVASFELVYAGKVFPGVSGDGVYLAGMSKADAATHLNTATASFASNVVAVNYGNATLHVPLNTLGLNYDATKVSGLAFGYGRTGSLWRRMHEQIRALLERDTNFAAYTYDDAQLTPYLTQVSDGVDSPVADASLSFNNNQAQVTPASDGQRLDLGQLVLLLQDRFATTSVSAVTAPAYPLPAVVSTTALTSAVPEVNADLAAPLQLSYGDNSKVIDQPTIATWMKVSSHPQNVFLETHDLRDLYPSGQPATLSLDPSAVTAYVDKLAAELNQPATNAQLAMQNGQLTVVKPSQDGVKLNTDGATTKITAALSQAGDGRTVKLAAQTTKAAVREDNLDSLGIKEQISEGETYFPGSPSSRLVNVRAGAAKFNDVLLAPGEQFSFGKLLGEVDAATGYVPELVIIGNHEEKQYGGGLCQVSSTAFRAALAAGLPINERVNHSFAISYYTWPYSVPGLDATIYYPDVDLKFTNDTGSYILIQTHMSGVDLKFDYFGTKTKSGVIRGPYFVSGDNDATKPSHTVFYRDVLDLAGNVTKTDTFNTYYQSSLNFPVEKKAGFN